MQQNAIHEVSADSCADDSREVVTIFVKGITTRGFRGQRAAFTKCCYDVLSRYWQVPNLIFKKILIQKYSLHVCSSSNEV